MLSDLDLNIAASTGIDDLNIADVAYDSKRGIVWAVDTEYGLIKLSLQEKTFVGMPVERLEGGLVSVGAAADGGAYGLTQRDGCVVKFAADLAETSEFTVRGAFGIAAGDSGVAAMFLLGGRLEVAKVDDAGKELWRTSVQDIAAVPRGARGTRLFVRGDKTIVIVGDPKLQAIILDRAGEIVQRVTVDLPGGEAGNGDAPIPVGGRAREEYLLASAVDATGTAAAMLYRAPGYHDRPVILVCSLDDPKTAPTAHAAKDNIDQFGGFDGDRVLCIGAVPGRSHGRIFTIRVADMDPVGIDEVLQTPAKPRWWEKYRLKFNVDAGFGHADELEEGRGNFGGQDIRY